MLEPLPQDVARLTRPPSALKDKHKHVAYKPEESANVADKSASVSDQQHAPRARTPADHEGGRSLERRRSSGVHTSVRAHRSSSQGSRDGHRGASPSSGGVHPLKNVAKVLGAMELAATIRISQVWSHWDLEHAMYAHACTNTRMYTYSPFL